MRGIATVERPSTDGAFAIWITNRTSPFEATHTNAVVVDAEDPDGLDKALSLTRCCAVLITDESTVDGWGLEGEPLQRSDVDNMLREVDERQTRIHAALSTYKERSRSKLVAPAFPPRPRFGDVRPPPTDPARPGNDAFVLASYLARAWTSWLKTDVERQRRTIQPKTGKTPWIMPSDLNDPEIANLPPGFASQLHEQPMV